MPCLLKELSRQNIIYLKTKGLPSQEGLFVGRTFIFGFLTLNMQVNTKAIVLSAIKYGDTSLIVKTYTASSGVKTYMLRGVLASRKGKLKPAYFQPLTQLEIVANHKDKGTLESIKEVKVSYQYQSIATSVIKNSVTLFLAEMLSHSLLEEEVNKPLFNFLEASLQWLDTHDDISNFHLFFLLQLTRYLGFYPDTADMALEYFDLQEGVFCSRAPLNPVICDKPLGYFRQFLGTNFEALHTIKMNKSTRQELLKGIILYYELHLQGFRKPKSLEVLNQIFS